MWAVKELIVKLLWGINQFCNYWLPNYFVFEEKSDMLHIVSSILYLTFA